MVAVALLLVAVTGAITYAARYQPLERGGSYTAGPLIGDRSTFVRGRPVTLRENVFGTEAVVGPLPLGGRLGFAIDLYNNGRFPVTVLGVDPILPRSQSRGTQMFATADESAGEASLVPVSSFTVPAHGTRSVAFSVDVRDCKAATAGTEVIIGQVHLAFRFLGIRHTTWLSLQNYAVALRGPPICY